MAWPAFKQIRFQQLRAFGEAARTGSFARAAAVLGVSRPAVWQQIRALEREFGAAFLLRRGNRLELTREGRLLAELVAPLVSGFASLRTRFEERRGENLRRLAVATTSGLLAGLLQAPIREFRRRHPEVQLTFLDRVSAEAVKLVTEGATELGVVGHLEEDPVHPLLEYETLASCPFRAVYRPDHPLARCSRIRLRDLLGFPLVLMAKGSRARSRVERVFREEVVGREPNLSMDTTNALMILEFVKMGLGVGIGSFVTEAAPRWRLKTRDLSRLFGRERVVIIRRRDDPPDAVTDAFRRILGEHLQTRAGGG